MTEYVVFTKDQYEAGIEEMASNMFHGGFLTRRAIGDPVEDVTVMSDADIDEVYDQGYNDGHDEALRNSHVVQAGGSGGSSGTVTIRGGIGSAGAGRVGTQ